MVLWPIRSISSRRRAPAATGRALPRTAQITEMKAGQVREGRGKPRSSLVTESRLPLASPVVPARIGDGLNPLPQHRHAPRHEAGSVHQVAEYQPVPDADDPAWPEQERPVVDRDERPADGDERARAACASDVLPQRHDRKEADGADGDEGAFNDTGGDIAEGEVLVLPFEDRKQLFLGEANLDSFSLVDRRGTTRACPAAPAALASF